MIEKLSVNVYIPAVGDRLDFLIPSQMSVAKIIKLMAKILVEEYQGIKVDLKELILINLRDNNVLDQSCNLQQLGIMNGSKLMLL